MRSILSTTSRRQFNTWHFSFPGYKEKPQRATDKALLSAFDTMKEPASSRQSLASETEVGSTNGADKDTPHVKKRHRRMKSSGVKNGDEGNIIDYSALFAFTINSPDALWNHTYNKNFVSLCVCLYPLEDVTAKRIWMKLGIHSRWPGNAYTIILIGLFSW